MPPDAMTITPTIAAIMSVPRLGWQDHFGSVQRVLQEKGIRLSWYTGAFWHKCMQQSLTDHLSADWILTLDYDTLFNHTQLDILLSTFGLNPTFDALAALQPRRGNGAPLMTVKDEKGKKQLQADGSKPIKAHTAHFGMTLIRSAALKTLPKPWFQNTPDKDGEWGADSIDADIYFWKVWEKAGKNVYVDPNVRIGHMELMVSIFDDFMVQRYVSIGRWREMYNEDGAHGLETKETRG